MVNLCTQEAGGIMAKSPKMKKPKHITSFNVLLGIGIAFVLTCAFLFASFVTGITMESLLDSIWPVIVIIAGVSVLISGLYICRGTKASVLVPSFSLILLGGFFLLFSLGVIEESFSQLFGRWWPLAAILAAICLVVLFFGRNARRIRLKDVEDDFNDLEDIN